MHLYYVSDTVGTVQMQCGVPSCGEQSGELPYVASPDARTLFLERTSWLVSQAALPVTCKPTLWCAYKVQDLSCSQNKGQFPGLAVCV